ncbi:MAG: Alpha/Beta hydrolase protein [Benjaminiella poitrasii]|nr:MAG: Alpha/Beta hydrolase protein [Benjaminiella poitrasii]
MLKLLLKLSGLLMALYIAIIGILSIDTPQRCIIFLHWVKFPFNPKFNMPEYYGFGHNMGRNIKIKTSDNVTIGAWHFVPKIFHEKHQLRNQGSVNQEIFDSALADPQYDTVIYFHGNALNRAAPWRIDFYKKFILYFTKTNLITIDYRGFGDSESTPTEAGLRLDAQATVDWLNQYGVSNNRISLIGHSLGTGVATTLAHDMSLIDKPPKSLILKAGYSSMTTLIFEYNIVPFLPILSPIKRLPNVEKWILSKLNHKFNSLSRIEEVQCPILILYGSGDLEIPISNSHQLFKRALLSSSVMNADRISLASLVEEQKVVSMKNLTNEAIVYESINHQPRLVMIELKYGDHNNVGYFDLAYQYIGDIMENKSS